MYLFSWHLDVNQYEDCAGGEALNAFLNPPIVIASFVFMFSVISPFIFVCRIESLQSFIFKRRGRFSVLPLSWEKYTLLQA